MAAAAAAVFWHVSANSTVDLRPSIGTKRETLLPLITLESFAGSLPSATEMQFSLADQCGGKGGEEREQKKREKWTYTINSKQHPTAVWRLQLW